VVTLCADPVEISVELRDEFLDELRGHEVRLEAGQYDVLEQIAANPESVGAGLLRLISPVLSALPKCPKGRLKRTCWERALLISN